MEMPALDSLSHKNAQLAAHGLELWREITDWPRDMGTSLDPIGMSMPIAHAFTAWLMHPQELSRYVALLNSEIWRLQQHFCSRMMGLPSEDPVRPHPDDNRFADPVWTEAAGWDLVKEVYLAYTHTLQDMLYATPGISDAERRKAAFWWRKWLNMVAPTNFLFTNPVALRLAMESHGVSLINGFKQFLTDAEVGNVRMTDLSKFKVGENLATTPGSVVARNKLLEVIHYAPTSKEVHSEPIVIVTPWINKFYVLDMTPKRSMVAWLLNQGFDVFITSWRNPDASMRATTFDSYLTDGIDFIVQTARQFTGAKQVHAAAYCIGGTALTAYMAWINSKFSPKDQPVASWTLFTTLTDFSAPGDIEVFIDESSINYLCRKMDADGYLDGKDMAVTFRLLRSNSLIWHYVVHGWLYGETPMPFDVLFWNMDCTRMPAAMHKWYLRELYLHNRLIQPNALTIAGEPINLGNITQPLYSVATEDDHIAPWKQVFRTMNHLNTDRRFVLSSSGHILGILNPPVTPPKRTYRASNVDTVIDAEHWQQGTEVVAGSWWEDWMAWLKPKAGAMVAARPAATAKYPEIVPAPGKYVVEP